MGKKHRIAVLSDTHSLLRPEIREILQSCEVILHAGDIASQELERELRQIAPTYFVRGNADKQWAEGISEERTVVLFGFQFYMVHNRKHIRKELEGIDVVIYGHSHRYESIRKDGILYLNPGSCGPRRFHLPVTMAVLTIDEEGHSFSVEKIDCSPIYQQGTILPERDRERLIRTVVKDMDAGRPVSVIAERNRIDEELVRQILQIYTTHPGIDVDGILNRMDILGK